MILNLNLNHTLSVLLLRCGLETTESHAKTLTTKWLFMLVALLPKLPQLVPKLPVDIEELVDAEGRVDDESSDSFSVTLSNNDMPDTQTDEPNTAIEGSDSQEANDHAADE